MGELQFELDVSLLERIGGSQGSNPAGIFQDDEKRRFYVKTLESVAHARNERIAAKLYQLAGVPTLSYWPTKDSDQVATRWVELDKKCVAHLTETERLQAQQWFGVHAWLANWDAAGFHGDNQGVINGKVLTLDVGGSLSFRACGDPKGKAFGTSVNELELMRTDTDNPFAVKLFADMSRAAIQQAIRRVTELPDQVIEQTILELGGHPKLVTKMLARKSDMEMRLPR